MFPTQMTEETTHSRMVNRVFIRFESKRDWWFPGLSPGWATMVTLTVVALTMLTLPVATPSTAALSRVGRGSVVVGEGQTRLQSRLELG